LGFAHSGYRLLVAWVFQWAFVCYVAGMRNAITVLLSLIMTPLVAVRRNPQLGGLYLGESERPPLGLVDLYFHFRLGSFYFPFLLASLFDSRFLFKRSRPILRFTLLSVHQVFPSYISRLPVWISSLKEPYGKQGNNQHGLSLEKAGATQPTSVQVDLRHIMGLLFVHHRSRHHHQLGWDKCESEQYQW
jgi:hypothetical protein